MTSVAPMSSLVSASGIDAAYRYRKRKKCPTTSQCLLFWRRMQLSYYGGKYSFHRMLALDEYCKNTPLYRVLFICLVTPLSMVALVFGQELIPLQDLSEGWSASYGLWIREAVLVGIVSHALLIQATYLISDFHVTLTQRLKLYVIMPTICVTVTMFVAANCVFPIPFLILVLPPPFYVLLIIMVRLVIGRHDFSGMLTNRAQVSRCLRFVCAQTSTVFIFPLYEILFSFAEGTIYRLPVIFLLPVIKVALKNLVLYFAKSLEDMAPVEVIFTADFFNAIYVATSIKSSTSLSSILAITITDLSQTLIMLYGLQRRTATIRARLGQVSAGTGSILSMISAICRDPHLLRTQVFTNVQRRSCIPLRISSADKSLLDCLDQICSSEEQAGRRRSSTFPDKNFPLSCFRARSLPNDLYPTTFKTESSLKHSTILVESLQILFTTECLVTTAYLEAFMPLFYSGYMAFMVHIPNARYHLELAKVTQENIISTVIPLVVFGILQIVSFFLLTVVIKRNCRMMTLHQLAFVLETQWSLVQCKMMLWMVITLCFRVSHFGKSHGRFCKIETANIHLNTGVDFKLEFFRRGLPRFWIPQG
ncbi:hypothetical protein Plhal304r1_c021g0075401 [Plasmopara halstedii]